MIIERTTYHPKAGRFDEVLENRRRACAQRARIGLPVGDVFVGEGDAGRIVFWECAFGDEAEHERDLAARAADPGFEAIRETMRALIDHFDRCAVRRAPSPGLIGARDLDGHPVAPREVRFTSGAHELVGYLGLPPGEGPFPCMITNHGSTIFQGTTEWCRPGIAALLMEVGIASFLPHRHGYGNSPGPAWRSETGEALGTEDYDRRLAARLDRESDDVVAALAAVRAEPAIDPQRIGVMGSSFGGTVTLLAASKCADFRCAVEFAGAAMNWDHTPVLRETMLAAAARVTRPIFFIQAENDYSIRPTRELAASLEGTGKVVESRVYPPFGLTRDEGHLLYRDGPVVWWPDVRRFLERWL